MTRLWDGYAANRPGGRNRYGKKNAPV